MLESSENLPQTPWWSVRMMWLVVGGPLVVVIASMVTLVMAVRGGDRPILETSTVRSDPSAPATQARNHAVHTAPR